MRDKILIILSLFLAISCVENGTGRQVRDDSGEFLDDENKLLLISNAYRTTANPRLTDMEISEGLNRYSLTELEYVDIVDSSLTEGNSRCNAATGGCYRAGLTGSQAGLVDCSLPQGLDGIQKRMDECIAKNPGKTFWKGADGQLMGEVSWDLVARVSHASISGEREIWRDRATGLIWSDVVASTSWCKAAGNSESQGGCDTDNNPSTNPGGNIINICHIGLGNADDQFGKGDINGIGPDEKVIHWRLPTRNELLQADINGIRFVLRKFREAVKTTSNFKVWTSSTRTQNPAQAWSFNAQEGTLDNESKTSNNNVICVGWAVEP
jgi:hypothetical protein